MREEYFVAVNVKNYAVVQLPVRDLEASVRWYKEMLGIPFTFEYTPGDQEAWLNVGGVGLGLVRRGGAEIGLYEQPGAASADYLASGGQHS